MNVVNTTGSDTVIEARGPYYDVTLARVRPRTVPPALACIEAWLKDGNQAELVGCLFSDLGTVNQILILRRFVGIRALLDERARTPLEADPLGISEYALELVMNIAVVMPGAGQQTSAGPYFEVRSDVIRPGALGRAIELWKAAAAPAFGVYTLAGDRPTILHVWPGVSLDERGLLADDVVPSNIWRHAAPDDLPLSQRAQIFRAAAFSPMQ